MSFWKRLEPILPAAFSSRLPPKIGLADDRRREQGAWIFLVSLSVFFFSCMFLYAIYVMLRIAPMAGEIEPFFLPRSFILTTINLIAISILLHMGVAAARSQRLVDLQRYIAIAFVLSLLFFVTQGTGLASMIGQMLQPATTMRSLYGLTFVLVIVHALHVVGGVAGLTLLLFGLSRNAYDHERYFPVKFCALYWHFLDAVWITMLAAFALAAAVSN